MAEELVYKKRLKELFYKAGAGRISEEALEEASKVIESFAELLAKRAVELSKHAKRETVKREDIKLAVKE
jgi:histone H3/H4